MRRKARRKKKEESRVFRSVGRNKPTRITIMTSVQQTPCKRDGEQFNPTPTTFSTHPLMLNHPFGRCGTRVEMPACTHDNKSIAGSITLIGRWLRDGFMVFPSPGNLAFQCIFLPSCDRDLNFPKFMEFYMDMNKSIIYSNRVE